MPVAKTITKLLTQNEVMEVIPFGRSKIWKMRKEGKFPKGIRIDRCLFFHEDEVIKWIESFRSVPVATEWVEARRQSAIEPALPTGYKSTMFQDGGK